MQKKLIVLIGLALSVTFANSLCLKAEEDNIEPEFESDKPPGGRVPGGTRHTPNLSRGLDVQNRDSTESSNILTILAPEGRGYTISKQPRLCWHLSKIIKNPIMVSIMYADPLAKEASTEPVLETLLQVSQAGVQIIDLSKYNIELKTGIEYEWSIDIVTGKRSLNKAISSGMIQRIEQSAELIRKIDNANEKEKPLIYAEAELWYDAISSLSDLIEKYPMDKILQNQRIELFKRIGLKNVIE